MASIKLVKGNNTKARVRSAFTQNALRILTVGFLILAVSPASANESDEMFCSVDGLERKVFIKLENPQSAIPCDVMENKQVNSPESAVSLWSAGDDATYCKRMMVNYIEKLRGLGFECWPVAGSEIIEKTINSELTE